MLHVRAALPLLAVFSLLLVQFPATAAAQSPDVTVEVVTSALDNDTIGLAHAGDGSGRLFAITQGGEIQIWTGSQVLPQPFLDIGSLVTAGGELGLLGLAFHPNYSSNGYFYVNYSDLSGDTVVARYNVSANANVADPGSGSFVMRYDQPATNHNGGDLHFGPDGFLYISSGDGGVDGGCTAQDPTSRLGKILRIDIDGDDFPADANANYAIPAGNPLVGVTDAAEEIWIMGARNPWRFSFDRMNGDLFIGDVGEDDREEFDHLPAGVGGINLGWPWFEAELAFNSCALPVTGPFATCDDAPFSCPMLTLDASPFFGGPCSAIGGYRYRGEQHPGLDGLYFHTDWCEGEIYAALEDPPGTWTSYGVSSQGFGVTGFGEDESGELYFVNSDTLYRITGDGFPIFVDGFESGDPDAWVLSGQ